MQKTWHNYIFMAVLSVCLVVPFSIDIFISGLPAISNHFPGANVSLLLSVALLGIAMAQPIYGPLLDRFGRRPVLLIGLCIYTLASAEVMLVNSFSLLLIGRFFQAAGACTGIISTLAIARDTYNGEKLVKATSLIMAMIAISPTLAPLIGSLLNTVWGWRASFIFLFIMGFSFVLLIYFSFKETLQTKNKEALLLKHIIKNYLNLAKQADFLMYGLISGFSYAILFSYFNLSSLFIIEQMHFNLISYGILVAINAIAMVIMALLAPFIIKRSSIHIVMYAGLVVIFCGGLSMVVINNLLTTNIYTFMFPMFLTMIGIGMIRPTASANAMQLATQKTTGSAAAFFNFIGLTSGAVATVLTTKLINVASFGLFITAIGMAALLLVLVVRLRILERLILVLKVMNN